MSLYTFDSKLTGPVQVFRSAVTSSQDATGRSVAAGSTATEKTATGQSHGSEAEHTAGTETAAAGGASDWMKALDPRGPETRLGESLLELIRQVSGRTLSGIVVLSDGASNAGLEPTAAHAAALAARVRLIAVGVGGLEEPANVQVANIQAPTDVQVGDAFDLSAFIQGQGVGRKTVQVELWQKQADDTEPVRVEARDVTLVEDGVPVQVTFHLHPSLPGETDYTVRVTAPGLQELSLSDNERTRTVNLVDRKTKVLLIAGGPMREYRFVRNLLYRHSAIELDVWLQTVDAGTAVSQDADRLLLKFPETREDLFQYDVLIAFDPDWSRLTPEARQVLAEWVFSQSGGLILVAGDIYTPHLAGSKDEMKPIGELYPVILTPFLLEYQLAKESQQAWPIRLTQAGREADFLQIADDPYQSRAAWKEFSGVYRCYPTSGAKAGATVYARHSDPRAQTEFGPPILMATQFYGSGQVLYIGTSEMWRLRRLDEAFHDRLWTKMVRKVGQARLQRGTNRGLLLLERSEYWLGQTVSVRAQLLDPQFRPLEAPAVAVEVYTPAGKPLVPELRLLPDKNRPGQFVGSFRAALPGTYRLEIPIPQSNDVLAKKIEVLMPNRETDQARQNAQLLRNLVRDTGGAYLTLDEAAQAIP
ncbi:MAG TPA: hypothetical protein EYP14_08555, partial [Planctomycetaceae bacterium]|nr:hypothetical protein [Planctomycetaceae bacterium]